MDGVQNEPSQHLWPYKRRLVTLKSAGADYLRTGLWRYESLRGGERTISFTARTRGLAEQLVALEAPGRLNHSSPAKREFSVCDQLRQPLRALAGAAALHTLLSRALTLSKVEAPRLANVKLNLDGNFEGLTDIDPPLSEAEAIQVEVLILGNMIELLSTFLGETMALRLIQGVWPKASFADKEFEDEGKV